VEVGGSGADLDCHPYGAVGWIEQQNPGGEFGRKPG
jgi:hypothetical protein